MRKTIFGVANSLDNYIARSDGGMDWIHFSDAVRATMVRMFATIDTVIFGRRTYEATLAMGAPLAFSAPVYVCSRAPLERADARVTVVQRDAVEFVREQKAASGRDICIMGGGVLLQSLLESRQVDELHVNIHPLLLGRGVPLFLPLAREVKLELIEATPLPGECVGISYRVR